VLSIVKYLGRKIYQTVSDFLQRNGKLGKEKANAY